jgi:uncharacterized DUF497 family protein
MYNGIWDWDDAKNEQNLEKHGFDFWHAARVFDDPNHLISKDRIDPDTGEQRWHAIGRVNGLVITVTHTYRRKLHAKNENDYYIHFVSGFESSKRDEVRYYAQAW